MFETRGLERIARFFAPLVKIVLKYTCQILGYKFHWSVRYVVEKATERLVIVDLCTGFASKKFRTKKLVRHINGSFVVFINLPRASGVYMLQQTMSYLVQIMAPLTPIPDLD